MYALSNYLTSESRFAIMKSRKNFCFIHSVLKGAVTVWHYITPSKQQLLATMQKVEKMIAEFCIAPLELLELPPLKETTYFYERTGKHCWERNGTYYRVDVIFKLWKPFLTVAHADSVEMAKKTSISKQQTISLRFKRCGTPTASTACSACTRRRESTFTSETIRQCMYRKTRKGI